MVIDESKTKDVQFIYQLVLNGTTLRDAAEEVNKLGLRTQLNKPFCETSISKMIKNPIYNGRRRFKGLNLPLMDKIISVMTGIEHKFASHRTNYSKVKLLRTSIH